MSRVAQTLILTLGISLSLVFFLISMGKFLSWMAGSGALGIEFIMIFLFSIVPLLMADLILSHDKQANAG